MICLCEVVEKGAKRGRHERGVDARVRDGDDRRACAAILRDVDSRFEANISCVCLRRPVRAVEAIFATTGHP